MGNWKRLLCRFDIHEYWGVLPRRIGEDNWSWLMSCKRCGAFEEQDFSDSMMEWLTRQKEKPDG